MDRKENNLSKATFRCVECTALAKQLGLRKQDVFEKLVARPQWTETGTGRTGGAGSQCPMIPSQISA